MPALRRRLRQPRLKPRDLELLDAKIQHLSDDYTARITDALDWTSAEASITEFTDDFYAALTLTSSSVPRSSPSRSNPKPTSSLDRALEVARDRLEAIRATHAVVVNNAELRRAKRRHQRLTKAVSRRATRRQFHTRQTACVSSILHPDTATATNAPQLDRHAVLEYFQAVGRHVPSSKSMHQKACPTWKVSFVRLIPKKGNLRSLANWRPICLQQALYKLYSGVLAKKFSQWLEQNERLTLSQKGFRPFNGCNEHNFQTSALYDCMRRKKNTDFCVVWYDLQNAFGSVPHSLMWYTLAKLGLPPSFLARVQDIFTNSSFMVMTQSGLTAPVPLEQGVYQGCPLSPSLFVATMTSLVRALRSQSSVGIKLAKGNPRKPTAKPRSDRVRFVDVTTISITEALLSFSTHRAPQLNQDAAATIASLLSPWMHVSYKNPEENMGEITSFGFSKIVSAAGGMGGNDIFIDVGCGIGNVVLQAAIQYHVATSVGVDVNK
ncbi:TPA: hypothetical protein N0F65_012660 [Lagenidium giganteum]|uniref:Histone-lysine N-methyltransferase, H3 lysine-79 specific n=1 Tax=Lagenidium giganteum TaxID=4803 RepID=A0AAV2YNL9_9STRA|nr:TPA: hypothetical protein N0F65_012660 [Lagenidium giganteum]